MTAIPPTSDVISDACPVCGEDAILKLCYPCGGRVCPKCERLTWIVRTELAAKAGLSLDEVLLESLLFEDLGLESLEDLEAVLAIEERTGIRFVFDLPDSPSVRGIIASLRRQEEMMEVNANGEDMSAV